MALTAQVVAAQSTLHNSIASGLSHWNANLAQKHALNLHVNTKNLSQPLGRISGDLKQFESALAASNARVIAFGASTAVLGGVAKTFKEIAVATIEVEKALTDVNRVFGLSSEGLKNFSKDLFNISKQTASAFSEVSTAALEFSRQGLGTEETLRRVNDALILVRLTGVSTTQAVEDLTAVVNAYSDAALNTTEVLNKIVAVEQQFAVSAADLTVAVSRTGQAAQEAGVNFDELNALVTAVQERTARGGAVIGNALKTIFTRLGRSDTLDQLERFNIAVRDVEGNVLPAVDILRNLATSYKTLSDTTRASLSEQVAGVYQVNILKSLLSDLADNQGVYNKAVSIGEKATNEATLANEKLNKTLSALISQTGTALLQLGNNIGKTTFEPVFRFLVEPFNEAIVYINDLLEGEGIGSDFANGLLKGIRNVISGPGLVLSMAVVFKVVYNTLRDVTKALPAVLGITTAAQKTLQVQESILGILQSESDAQRALYGLYGNKNAAAELALQIAQAQTAEYKEQVAYATELAALAVKKGVVVSPDIGLSVKTKSSGYIPNFSSGGIPSNVRSKEIRGALNGGYTPGSVIAAPKSIGGVMNSAEKVKYVPGFAQPFINPPRNSKAGMLHQQRAISSVGVDPYSGSGYIPNFAANQYTYVGNTPLMNPSGRVIKKGDVLKKAEMSGFTRLLVGKADLENFDKDDVLKVRSLFRPVGDTPEYTIAGKAGLATAELKPVSSAVPRSNDEEPDVLGKPIPSKINTPAEINAASIVAFMGKSLTDDEAWRVGKKALKDVDNIQGISEEKRKELKSAIEKEMAPIKRAFGAEYEAFAMNELRKLGFSSIQTAESLKLYGWDRGQTAVDAVDMKTKTFFEFKGGEFKTKDGGKDDVNSKFKRVRMNPGNFDILTGHQWKNVLVSNKYNEGARPGNKTIYLNPSQHSGPRQYLKERVQTPTGTETKTFGPVPITGSIMDEIFAEADRTKKTFKGNLFGGYIPNFAYNLKKVGSGIGELSISTNQENAGMLMGEYAQAFAQAKKMNLQTIRGKLVRQKRQPRDPNDPVSIIKADIPQIIRGRFGNSSSLHLAGQAFHFNSRTFDADLSSQAASLAALLTKSPHTNIELYTDLFKSKGKGSSKLSSGTLDYEARKKALLGMSGGYIPNFAIDRRLLRDIVSFNLENSELDDLARISPIGRAGGQHGSVHLYRGVSGESPRWMDLLKKYTIFQGIPTNIAESKVFEPKTKDVDGFVNRIKEKGFFDVFYDYAKGEFFDAGTPITSTSTSKNAAKDFSGSSQTYFSKKFPISRIFSKKSLDRLIEKHGQEKVFDAIKQLSRKSGRGLGFDINSILDYLSPYKSEKEVALLSRGFIPNFAYKNQVMGLEESLSGNKAVYSSSPFPHIRNTSQPTFSSAIADHGGLNNALKDSFANQSMAGLVSKGFVPNFADFDITGTPLSGPKGQAVSFKKINAAVNNYVKSTDLTAKNNFVLNTELQKVIGQLGLSKQSFEEVRKASLEFAKKQRTLSQILVSAAAQTSRNSTSSALAGQLTTSSGPSPSWSLGSAAGFSNSLNSRAAAAQAAARSARQPALASAYSSLTGPTQNISQISATFSKVLSGLRDKMEKYGTALAIGLPMLTGAIEQFIFNGKDRSQMSSGERFGQSFLSSGASTISSGAFTGSLIMPGWGTAIGAAIGGLTSLGIALSATKLSAEELIEAVDKQRQLTQESSSAAEKYIQAQEKFAQLSAIGANQIDLDVASKNVANSFNEIKNINLANSLSKTQGGLEELNRVLNKYKIQEEQLASALSFAAQIKGGKTSGTVNVSQRARELSSSAISSETLKQLSKFSLKTEQFIDYLPSGGDALNLNPKTRPTKQSEASAKSLASILAKEAIGDRGTPEQISEFQNSIVQILLGDEKTRKEILDALSAQSNLLEEAKKTSIETANLFLERNRLSSELTSYVAKINSELKTNDFSRKISESIFSFADDLAASFSNPLDKIRAKFDFESNKLASEGEDAIKKLNSEFIEKNFEEVKNKITSQRTLEAVFQDFEKAKKGDFSGIRSFILNPEVRGNNPELIKALEDNLNKLERDRDASRQDSKDLQAQLVLEKDLQSNRERNLIFGSEILKKEIVANSIRERLEILRKNNIELEIDSIERQSNDPASLLGKGIEGKAEERNRFRTLLLQKRLQDQEVTRSRSAQKEYSEVLETQREILLSKAAVAESVGSTSESDRLRREASDLLPKELKSTKDIQSAIEEINTLSFETREQEESRIRTLESLKTVQEEINSGKIKEEEITRRINEEEIRNAKRSRSFRYGLETGFDEIRDEVDTFENRLGRSLPGTFKNGLVGALDAAINKTDDLGNALMDVASTFLRTIQNAMFEQIAGTLVTGVGASFKQKGGIIRAQNGMYISGGRTGDKNPAMLEDGEYVLNRQAVKALGGPRVLNDLNFNQFPRFANGGSTSASANMGIPFSNLSEFGKENNPEYGAYVDSLREKEAIKEAKKAKEKALINQLVATAITSAVTIGYSAGSKSSMFGKKSAQGSGTYPQGFEPTGNPYSKQQGGLLRFNSGGYLPYGNRLNDSIPALLGGGEYIVNNRAVRKYGVGGLNRINSGVAKFQDGGMVGSSGIANAGNTESSSSNNISINITVNSSNGKVNNEQTSVSGAKNEDGNALLAGKIKEVVLQVIASEQRTGGVLDSTKKK